jgi:hypothetical protein
MPPQIPRLIKTDIIRRWLEGESRTMIVNKCSLGAGNVQDLLHSPLKYKDKIPSLMIRYNSLKVNTNLTSLNGITDDSSQITN